MKLEGTKIEEKVQAAIAFGKAHRPAFDREKIAAIYRRANIPFTKAAERFWAEWFGVLGGLRFWPEGPNIFYDDGHAALATVDFWFGLMGAEQDLKYWYEPTCYPEIDEEDFEDIAGMIRAKYGTETVPVARGGYYYPSTIYVCPDGKVISILPDNGYDSERIWNRLEDWLCFELKGQSIDRVERLLEWKNIEGTLEERIQFAIAFAKAHGGFQFCRLFEDHSQNRIDLSRLEEGESLSEEVLKERLLQILKDQTPAVLGDRILLPGQIWFVEA